MRIIMCTHCLKKPTKHVKELKNKTRAHNIIIHYLHNIRVSILYTY